MNDVLSQLDLIQVYCSNIANEDGDATASFVAGTLHLMLGALEKTQQQMNSGVDYKDSIMFRLCNTLNDFCLKLKADEIKDKQQQIDSLVAYAGAMLNGKLDVVEVTGEEVHPDKE